MKNISETAVGLAYSALVLRDQGLAAEVRHLEDRLDEMKDRLELWVLRAAGTLVGTGEGTRRRCAGCCTCPRPPRTSATRPSTWCGWWSRRRSCTRSWPSPSARATTSSCGAGRAREPRPTAPPSAELRLDIEPGFHVLAIRRGRPLRLPARRRRRLLAGDELIASGPDEGHPMLTELLGWRLDEDEETGEQELVPLTWQ